MINSIGMINHVMVLYSLLYEMRVNIHFELAKICAQSDQLQTAIDHLNKVQSLHS